MKDDVLRSQLVELLNGHQAHVSLSDAIKGLKAENRSKRPSSDIPSVWEVLEHIRIAQEDIIRYSLDPGWKSPSFPDGYWPKPGSSVSEKTWNETVKAIESGVEEAVSLVSDTSRELTDEIPHGPGHTYLREILLVTDHNAYHLGQIVSIRKTLGDWPS